MSQSTLNHRTSRDKHNEIGPLQADPMQVEHLGCPQEQEVLSSFREKTRGDSKASWSKNGIHIYRKMHV